jgi:hypothetical protein
LWQIDAGRAGWRLRPGELLQLLLRRPDGTGQPARARQEVRGEMSGYLVFLTVLGLAALAVILWVRTEEDTD